MRNLIIAASMAIPLLATAASAANIAPVQAADGQGDGNIRVARQECPRRSLQRRTVDLVRGGPNPDAGSNA